MRFFDVATFLYYILTFTDPDDSDSYYVLGFFSKEKHQQLPKLLVLIRREDQNASKIVRIPWEFLFWKEPASVDQRSRWVSWATKAMSAFGPNGLPDSYSVANLSLGFEQSHALECSNHVLGQHTGSQTKFFNGNGLAEKPLSELGHKSYVRFWAERIARFLLRGKPSSSSLEPELVADPHQQLPKLLVLIRREDQNASKIVRIPWEWATKAMSAFGPNGLPDSYSVANLAAAPLNQTNWSPRLESHPLSL
jgi:hypothetical protein